MIRISNFDAVYVSLSQGKDNFTNPTVSNVIPVILTFAGCLPHVRKFELDIVNSLVDSKVKMT